MVRDKYLQFIPLSVEEDAASTLTEDEIDLPNSFVNLIATEIHCIEGEFSTPEDDPAAAAFERVAAFISTQPVSSEKMLNDDYVIWKGELGVRGSAAGGGGGIIHRYLSPSWWPKMPILIAHEKVYLYIISTNSSAAANFKGRMGVLFKRLTKDAWREAFETWTPTG